MNTSVETIEPLTTGRLASIEHLVTGKLHEFERAEEAALVAVPTEDVQDPAYRTKYSTAWRFFAGYRPPKAL